MVTSPPIVRHLQFEEFEPQDQKNSEEQNAIDAERIKVFLRLRPFTVDEIARGEQSAVLQVKENRIKIRPRHRTYMPSEVRKLFQIKLLRLECFTSRFKQRMKLPLNSMKYFKMT